MRVHTQRQLLLSRGAQYVIVPTLHSRSLGVKHHFCVSLLLPLPAAPAVRERHGDIPRALYILNNYDVIGDRSRRALYDIYAPRKRAACALSPRGIYIARAFSPLGEKKGEKEREKRRHTDVAHKSPRWMLFRIFLSLSFPLSLALSILGAELLFGADIIVYHIYICVKSITPPCGNVSPRRVFFEEAVKFYCYRDA